MAQPNYGNANYPPSYPSGQPVYNNQGAQYGTVSNVEYLAAGAADLGVAGAVAGGVVGGALGNQVGGGTGKALATVAGVVGGALIGRAIEQNVAGSHTVDVYRVTVRFDDGGARSFDYHQAPNVRVATACARKATSFTADPVLSGAEADKKGQRSGVPVPFRRHRAAVNAVAGRQAPKA